MTTNVIVANYTAPTRATRVPDTLYNAGIIVAMVAVSAEPRGKDFFALKKAWAHSGRPRRCTATVQKWAFEFSRRRSHRVDAIRQILSLARDAQSSVKHALAKRFAKLQKPGAALCSLPIVLAALEDLVAPQRLSDKPAARSSETGSIASFAACTTGRSTANSATDSSGSAAFISLRLLEGEELLQSSRIPSSIVEVGDGVTRKWSFQDLASNTEAHVAKIIGGGCFGEIIYYYTTVECVIQRQMILYGCRWTAGSCVLERCTASMITGN